jgi:hypothetical protein
MNKSFLLHFEKLLDDRVLSGPPTEALADDEFLRFETDAQGRYYAIMRPISDDLLREDAEEYRVQVEFSHDGHSFNPCGDDESDDDDEPDDYSLVHFENIGNQWFEVWKHENRLVFVRVSDCCGLPLHDHILPDSVCIGTLHGDEGSSMSKMRIFEKNFDYYLSID